MAKKKTRARRKDVTPPSASSKREMTGTNNNARKKEIAELRANVLEQFARIEGRFADVDELLTLRTAHKGKAATTPPKDLEALILQAVDRYEQLRGDFARLESRVEALADSIATINTAGLSAPAKGTTSPLGGAAIAR